MSHDRPLAEPAHTGGGPGGGAIRTHHHAWAWAWAGAGAGACRRRSRTLSVGPWQNLACSQLAAAPKRARGSMHSLQAHTAAPATRPATRPPVAHLRLGKCSYSAVQRGQRQKKPERCRSCARRCATSRKRSAGAQAGRARVSFDVAHLPAPVRIRGVTSVPRPPPPGRDDAAKHTASAWP